MDSAYQSQSGASQRRNQLPEGYQTLTPQDTRSHVSNQFMYSPSLDSDNFNAFQEQQPDMSHMQLPSAAADGQPAGSTFAYGNYSAGQDFSQYSTTTVPRFTPASGIDSGLQWGMADTQNISTPYNYPSFPKSTHGIDSSLFTNAEQQSELMFNTSTQRHMSRPQINTNVRPATVRHSSSYTSTQQGTRRPSANQPSFGPFVMSPTSPLSAHLPMSTIDFEQQHAMEASEVKEETTSASLAAQSIDDEEENLSASDALQAKTMEEEQGKLARSHPLYQALPDENGKYHCPNEGKAGCNHKPTPLKCNYDKYVDSHLKPFRCNKKACVGVQFSSTACLLRHEREAHGMHGHGSRPHLCHFADCERSVHGNGFPRRYNLFDHMKRVHDYTGPTTEPSPPASTKAGEKAKVSRKRKSTADEGTEKRLKVSKPTPQQMLQQKRELLQQNFLSKKQSLINVLAILNGPTDLKDDQQLHKEIDLLIEISTEYKKSLG
ncbi:hypothetical protein EJ04DRAFT_508225 [Polyplosphaeria fusca]|uniref:Uncharacterized protein n=1 Tax=Polyplosphaeria fusca TaxID=682080 RepID=A0A9P4RAD5_9PLEO|nr:hypothetical protein EJ04DRAFT_508225 [Polyplosphaeria fusca]